MVTSVCFTRQLIFVITLFFMPLQLYAEELLVAVASNFKEPMLVLKQRFELESSHTLRLSFGSTGKHYLQIVNGAPYDVFFSADSERPKRLDNAERVVLKTRFTYAIGRLVLWSAQDDYVDLRGEVLGKRQFYHLAIANPKLAPYGRAAREVLNAAGLWKGVRQRIVQGENIAQTYQFIHSGNAELGFVAFSQVKNSDKGSFWLIPPMLYSAIEQQVVILKDSVAAREFLRFIKSEESLQLIRDYGYDTP